MRALEARRARLGVVTAHVSQPRAGLGRLWRSSMAVSPGLGQRHSARSLSMNSCRRQAKAITLGLRPRTERHRVRIRQSPNKCPWKTAALLFGEVHSLGLQTRQQIASERRQCRRQSFLPWRRQYGSRPPTGTNPSEVPEPLSFDRQTSNRPSFRPAIRRFQSGAGHRLQAVTLSATTCRSRTSWQLGSPQQPR